MVITAPCTQLYRIQELNHQHSILTMPPSNNYNSHLELKLNADPQRSKVNGQQGELISK